MTDYMREYGFGAVEEEPAASNDAATHAPVAYPEQGETFLFAGLGAPPRGKRGRACAQDDEKLFWAKINVCVDYTAKRGPHEGWQGFRIGSSLDVEAFLREVTPADHVGTEFFAVLAVNANNEPVGVYEAHRGGISSSIVEPVVILQPVIQLLAPAFIVCHNHPSGQATPSPEDIELTKRIEAGAQILGLRFLDHVILASGATGQKRYFSFLDAGMLK